MTQKELSYVEDAIGHENNIICILNHLIDDIDDEDLTEYISTEIDNHQEMYDELIKLLEVDEDE